MGTVSLISPVAMHSLQNILTTIRTVMSREQIRTYVEPLSVPMRISVVADGNCTCGNAQFTTHINHDQNWCGQGTDTHIRWTPICSFAHICGGRWELFHWYHVWKCTVYNTDQPRSELLWAGNRYAHTLNPYLLQCAYLWWPMGTVRVRGNTCCHYEKSWHVWNFDLLLLAQIRVAPICNNDIFRRGNVCLWCSDFSAVFAQLQTRPRM